MSPLSSRLRRVSAIQWSGFALAAAGLLLPWTALLDWTAGRVNTVRGFYSHYLAGLPWLRFALLANGALAIGWPWLRRSLLEPLPLTPVPRPHDRKDLAAMGAIFLVGLALRLIGSGRSLQHDEWTSWEQWIRHGPAIIATRYDGYTNHVFYSHLAWLTTRIFGGNEFGLRLPSILAGALAGPALYGALRWSFDRVTGAAGGLILALSTISVFYSQEARGYALMLFCVAALFWLYRELEERPTLAAFAGTAVLSAAVLYARLYNLLILAAFAGAATLDAIVRKDRGTRMLRRTAFANLLGGSMAFLLYAINIPTVIEVRSGGAGAPDTHAGPTGTPAFLLFEDLAAMFMPPAVVTALWILALAGFAALYGRQRFAVFFAATLALLTLLHTGIVVGGSRYYMHLVVPMAAAQAAAVGWLWRSAGPRRWAGAALAAGLAVVLTVSVTRYHSMRKLDFRAAAEFLSARSGTEKVGLAHDSMTAQFYIRNPRRCVVVGEKSVDAEDPEWFMTHTETLLTEGRLATRIYARYREAWSQETMLWGIRLTVWRREIAAPRGP